MCVRYDGIFEGGEKILQGLNWCFCLLTAKHSVSWELLHKPLSFTWSHIIFPFWAHCSKTMLSNMGNFFPRKHRMACKFTEKGRRKHLTILSERVHYWTEITNKRISIHFSHSSWKHTLLVWTGWQVRRGSNWKVYGTDGLMVSMASPFGNVCTPSTFIPGFFWTLKNSRQNAIKDRGKK